MKKISTSLGNAISQGYPESLALFQNSWVVQRRIFLPCTLIAQEQISRSETLKVIHKIHQHFARHRSCTILNVSFIFLDFGSLISEALLPLEGCSSRASQFLEIMNNSLASCLVTNQYKPANPESTPQPSPLLALTVGATIPLPYSPHGQIPDNLGSPSAPELTEVIQISQS